MLGRLRGFLHAHLTWMIEHDYPNVAHYVPDLMADRTLLSGQPLLLWMGRARLADSRRDRRACDAAALWGALSGFLWGGVVRMFVVEQTMSAINSVMHTLRRAALRRPATTTAAISASWRWLAWGEGWHNNHHAFPYSAAFGLRWFEFDPGFLFIRLLEMLGPGVERQGAEPREDRAAQAAWAGARRPISNAASRRS